MDGTLSRRGGTLFSNIGGELSLEDISIENITGITAISIGTLFSLEGSAFLRRVKVSNSDVTVSFWNVFLGVNHGMCDH